jgi:hypothetical protein
MSQEQRQQQQRSELKYVISEQKARRVRDYIRSVLALDKNCVGKSDFSYAVYSLYVNSDSGLRWPVWRTPQPQRFGASGKVAAADGVARVNEEGALARAVNLGSLPPGASV